MLEPKKIDYKGNITKIYHIADVHIRNLKRHKEYREVFDRLYKYISDTKTDQSIIVLAGDIVHAKTDMTPEVVEMTHTFLKRLSDLLPTILIPGNHDANLNNPSRMDALTPIVNAINHTDLHYLKDDGAWEMGGITFVHTSVFGDSKNIISSDDVDGDYKIALYHGPVDRVKTEHGFQIQNKNVNVESFDGYDLVLLGDIHVPNQSLNDEETIKYCGSTIMQNHSESKYPEHGILVWDINTKQSEFVPIHNDYGYVTLDIENGKLVGNPKIPNKPRMRIRVNDTTQSQLDKILTKIKTKNKIQELSIQRVLSTNPNDSNKKSNISISNLDDVGFQNKLIGDFLNDKLVLSGEQIDIVKGINTDINNRITNNNHLKNIIWKPKRFEFSNMFSYGENNVIDFDNLNGAYGIFAPNASGKSSLWDALSFCIFDKCSRTSKAIDVLNNQKSQFQCKFHFEINGMSYYIERLGKKSPKRGTVKVDVDFYCIMDGQPHSLNGEERRETNSIIRQYVGSYDEFVLTAMSNQNNNGGFINKSQKERKELLAQFLNMNVFEKLYQIASEDIKELSGLVKDYKNQNLPEKLSEAQIELEKQTEILSETEQTLSKLKTDRNQLSDTIESLLSKIKPIDSYEDDIVTLNESKIEIESKLKNKEAECDGYIDILAKKGVTLNCLNIEYSEFNLESLKETYTKYQHYVELCDNLQTQISQLETDIDHKQKHLDGIGSLSFDDKCEHCIQNKNTPFAKQAKTLTAEISELKLKLINLKSEYENKATIKDEYDVSSKLIEVKELKTSITELKNEIDKINLKSNSCELELTKLNLLLESTNQSIQNWNNQKDSIEYNSNLEKEITTHRISLEAIDDDISETNQSIIDISGKISISTNTIQNVNESINRLELMEKKYDGYESYLSCVKRDGIPYQLISNILPKLEIEINNILNPLVDFQILLNTDGKNINSYIAYDDDRFWPLELTSGMEKFIASVAIRTALTNVSNLPRPNFIAIDEGFGSLDSDNFNSLYLLFDYLKTQFDFIVTISHIDKTRDMVDKIIDINKVGGFSHIQYL
jgi:DNA repair exonuclease SbcCD ATPase subunit/DNA repair exonuclease SbcCD nuclease subunit